MRYFFTDASWAAFEPLARQAAGVRRGQRPQLSERMFFEAILFQLRTGVPWRDLPGEFGCWLAVYQRFRRRIASGALDRLADLLTADPDLGSMGRVFIDSTIVRAHRHAAGARRRKVAARPSSRSAATPSAAAAAG